MQCDAINLVRYRSEKRAASTTTTGEMGQGGRGRKRGKFEKYPKCFHMMANTQKKRARKKKDGKRKDGTVVVVLQKLPWQKEFQHFVPLSKAGKRSTTWQHFFLFLLPSSPIDSASFFFVPVCRNNLHTFSLCLSLCRCCRKQNVLRAKKKCFLKEAKAARNEIESTRQILGQRQTTFRLFSDAELWNVLMCRSTEWRRKK